ncbi:MAG: hypothetical protein FWG55_07270 [Candidatus Bathyarchaeota archaeon]|nr:hypothetical protein [Candidatus Termiticorpusculum sp.]
MDNKTTGLTILCAVLAMMLVLSFVINADVQDNYDEGVRDGYNKGTTAEYSAGNQAGYSKGHQEGYDFGYGQGNQTGYDAGYIQGIKDGVGSGYNIRDPTYAEMITFIAQDQTDKNAYDANNYNCHDYASDVINNAFDQGYRARYVYIHYKDSAHAIVCFRTVDRGLVFIEPQTDDIVKVEVGIHYWASISNAVPKYDDTVIRFKIIW